MSTYLNVTSWIYNDKSIPMIIKIDKGAGANPSIFFKFEIEHSSVSFMLTREQAVDLKNKLENYLLDN